MAGRLFTLTSALQLLSLAGFVALIFVLARVVHHQTDNAFLPFWGYVGSFRIAFPPVVILVATYGLAFLAGRRLADVPADVMAFMRNRFFQSKGMMAGFLAAALAISAVALSRTEKTPPPAYENLVSAILAGEVDRSEEAKKLMKSVAARNPALADRLALVQQVFELRRQRNLEAKTSDVVRSRLLLRALTNAEDSAWRGHPLRKHALAEAHALLAESISDSGLRADGFGELGPEALFREAVRLYEEVRDDSPPRLGPAQLIASAQNNIGNVFFYQGRHRAALEAWRQVELDHPEFRNVGTLANMVAAHIALGERDEAVVLGAEARRWAEDNGKAIKDTAHYVSILVNSGFAHLSRGEIAASQPLFEFAALIEDDDNSKLNVAMSRAMGGDAAGAEQALRKVSAPVSYRDIGGDLVLSPDKRCSHLWWALHTADADPRDVAARLFVFLGEKHSAQEMEAFAARSALADLRRRVARDIGGFPGSCRTYSLFPPILDFIRGG